MGRGLVVVRNLHDQVQCQFSILLAPNEEPAMPFDFRSQLKNRVNM